jgi:hypothetical protein
MDMWGDSLVSYSLNISVVDINSKNAVAETGFIDNKIDSTYNLKLIAENDTINITLYCIPDDYNGKPHFFLEMGSTKNHWFSISAKATQGSLHMWNYFRVNNSLVSVNYQTLGDKNAKNGDIDYTIGDWVSGTEVVGVGAYVSKVNCLNADSVLIGYGSGVYFDALASFSSRGPTLSGLIKPDFCAPGMGVVASVNSFDTVFAQHGSSSSSVIRRVGWQGESYPYALLQGTSMSSPVATGTIALFLEANPKLTPQKVIELIKMNARTDYFTGPTIPNNLWGWGKLNAFSTIKDILGLSKVESEVTEPDSKLYPNPTTDFLRVEIQGNGRAEATILDFLGRELSTVSLDLGIQGVIDTKILSNGVYYLIVKQKEKIISRSKFIIVK